MTKKKKPEADGGVDAPARVIRNTTDYLRVDYTPDELATKAQDLAAKIQELGRVENHKKNITSDLGAKIKTLEAEVSTLTGQVSSKGEYRSIRCEWHMNTPRRGRKTLYRTDTLAVVREEEMIDNDCQMVMDDLKEQNGETERGIEEKEVTPIDREAEEGNPYHGNDQDEGGN